MINPLDLLPRSLTSASVGFDITQQASDYWVDAWQRSVLFLDVLRQRGNQHYASMAETAPNVLSFEYELIASGRDLPRPVNYGLLRIVPPPGVEIDPRKRPFMVFDPRAGHGPGIGGMKHDSEIGVALKAGHPCYFVGFLPVPVPGQTIEDVCRAEAFFVDTVAARHPEAEGKPCLIGNCQAGWQVMLMSALHADSVGPIVLAGAPLSYWAGVHGRNPLRYLGGLLGGSWLTSLAGDLGNGIFDGANLVANFESMNPANTLWKKNYHVYANVDTEAPRFLEFEKWWGNPVLLNAQEMQTIVDDLFVGNKLTSGELITSDGVRVDLRTIRSPIVVFCSWGDEITPPQQALGWVLDLYATDEALIANGQTIVYALHQSIGHLGIFVSAKVAAKEHDEFARTMDLIDALPPGLYEAVFTAKDAATAQTELISGDYLVRFEQRGLADLRALGGNDEADDHRFATVARLSEMHQGLYRTYFSPWISALTTPESAEWLRRTHPNRLRFEMFSDKNPWLFGLPVLAESVRQQRAPAAADNLFLAWQEIVSETIATVLDAYRDIRDDAEEQAFLRYYGTPAIQALAGLKADQTPGRWHLARDLAAESAQARQMAALESSMGEGDIVAASLRALLYVNQGRTPVVIDERTFATLRELRNTLPPSRQLSLPQFKEVIRLQYLMLHYDQEKAIDVLPHLLPEDRAERKAGFEAIRAAVEVAGDMTDEVRRRLAQIEAIFLPSTDEEAAVPLKPASRARRTSAP